MGATKIHFEVVINLGSSGSRETDLLFFKPDDLDAAVTGLLSKLSILYIIIASSVSYIQYLLVTVNGTCILVEWVRSLLLLKRNHHFLWKVEMLR